MVSLSDCKSNKIASGLWVSRRANLNPTEVGETTLNEAGQIHTLDVLRLVQAFSCTSDPAGQKSQELTVQLLEHTPNPFSRNQFTPGHVTATGLVLDPALRAVLLIHHRRLDRWLLPGGHVEPDDPSVWEAARREVVEETGAQVAGGTPAPLIGIDVHGIPPNSREPLHYHHDLVFSFRAESHILLRSEEVREARWFEIASLPKQLAQLQESIQLSIARALLRYR
jgi:8-oxo-dGTP pyrophosphatase MutT (NUDIX family)